MIEERSTVRAIGAALVLLGGVIAIPAILITQSGWPLPHAVPTWNEVSTALSQSVSDEIVLKVFAVAAWVVWFIFTVTVIEETVAAARGSNHRFVSVGPLQVFVASLVGAIVLALPTDIKVGAPTPQYSLALATQAVSSLPPPVVVATPKPALVAEPSPQTVSYTVVHRDTLWAIATRHLGDGTRWHEIWDLNKNATQADGRVFANPAKIHPGWTIQLPAEANVSDTPDSQPAAVAAPSHVEPAAVPQEQPSQPMVATVPVVPQAEMVPEASPTTSVPAANSIQFVTDAGTANAHGGVTLASGGLVGATLASGIGAALVAARLRRRRLYMPGVPRAGVVSSDPLLTDVVQRLRAADLAHKAEVDEIDDGFPARAYRPGTVTVAVSANEEQTIDLTSLGGMSLDAVGDLDHARALVLGFISNLPPEDADVVIVGEALAGELLGSQRSFPGLRVEANGESVLTRADADMLTRTRLLGEGDYEDIDAFRKAHPIESIPARLIVISSSDPDLVGRAKATAMAGKKLGIGVVIIDGHHQSDVSGSSVNVVDVVRDGRATELEQGAQRVQLSQKEAIEIVTVVEAARSDVVAADLVSEVVEQVYEDVVVDNDDALPDLSTRRVELRLFGPSRVLIDGIEPKRTVRRQVRELMSFLALRPLGATADAAGAAIWPETNQRRAQQRIRNLHGSANTDLRALTGLDGDFIERAGERYRLNTQLIDCDWWRFERAIAASQDDADSLQRAVSEYVGCVAEGSDWLWIDVVREDAQRQMLSICSRLAALLSDKDDLAAACLAIERACNVDPYNETLHQELMKLQAKLGKHGDVERTYCSIEERLNTEIGVQVSEQTRRLRDELNDR